jgi:anti-sigma factor RsiW
MADPPFDRDPALARRWLDAAAALPAPDTPDALTLAAYAEGRLDDAAAAAVEAALAADPALLDALLTLRQPAETTIPSAALIQSAQALVGMAAGDSGGGQAAILPFRRNATDQRRPAIGSTRRWLAWGAVAAGLMIVSTAGFNLGMSTAEAFNPPAATDLTGDLLDPSGLAGDDSG